MKVISKSKADKFIKHCVSLIRKELGNVGINIIKTKHCTGKYTNSMIGKEVADCGAHVVFSSRSKDKDGPYYNLWSYTIHV